MKKFKYYKTLCEIYLSDFKGIGIATIVALIIALAMIFGGNSGGYDDSAEKPYILNRHKQSN